MLESQDQWQQWFLKQAFHRRICRWKNSRQRVTKKPNHYKG